MAVVLSALRDSTISPSAAVAVPDFSDPFALLLAESAFSGDPDKYRFRERRTQELLPAGTSGFSLRRVSGPLGLDAPSADDPVQGNTGDCYFIASLASIANMRPSVIRDMVREVAPNIYEVRFFDIATGRPVYQRVSGTLPVDANGKPLYARSSTGRIWPIIVEKAFAARYGGYEQIRSGRPTVALAELTGKKSEMIDVAITPSDKLWARLVANVADRSPMTANLNQNALLKCEIDAGGLPSDHIYSVLGISIEMGQRYVILREPNARFIFGAPYQTQVHDRQGNVRPGVFRMRLEDFNLRFRNLAWSTDTPLEQPKARATAAPQTRRDVPARKPPSKVTSYRCPPALPRRPAPPKPSLLQRVLSWRPWS